MSSINAINPADTPEAAEWEAESDDQFAVRRVSIRADLATGGADIGKLLEGFGESAYFIDRMGVLMRLAAQPEPRDTRRLVDAAIDLVDEAIDFAANNGLADAVRASLRARDIARVTGGVTDWTATMAAVVSAQSRIGSKGVA